jgi:rfaE bifunctional protein nucleotidyltransferase chain/domain
MASRPHWPGPPDGLWSKVLPDLGAATELMARLKREARRVIFTNGAFDILHVGHVRSLRHARSLGDHLMVAVNSDRSVRAAKGPDRPVFPAAERIEVLAGLACVDSVFVFDDATVDAVLRVLQPHVHAKGPDYAAPGVPERATVAAYGGEIAIVGDPKDHSSSEIRERLKGER